MQATMGEVARSMAGFKWPLEQPPPEDLEEFDDEQDEHEYDWGHEE